MLCDHLQTMSFSPGTQLRLDALGFLYLWISVVSSYFMDHHYQSGEIEDQHTIGKESKEMIFEL